MRIPQPRPPLQSVRATKPSTPPSHMRQTGPQGTPGGRRRRPGMGRQLNVQVHHYLWLLVGIEVAVMVLLRNYFRRHHGG